MAWLCHAANQAAPALGTFEVLYWHIVYGIRRIYGIWYMVKGSVDQRRRQRISGHINQINEIEDSYSSKRVRVGVEGEGSEGVGYRESFRRSADDFCGWPNVFIATLFGYQKAKQKRKQKQQQTVENVNN